MKTLTVIGLLSISLISSITSANAGAREEKRYYSNTIVHQAVCGNTACEKLVQLRAGSIEEQCRDNGGVITKRTIIPYAYGGQIIVGICKIEVDQ